MDTHDTLEDVLSGILEDDEMENDDEELDDNDDVAEKENDPSQNNGTD